MLIQALDNDIQAWGTFSYTNISAQKESSVRQIGNPNSDSSIVPVFPLSVTAFETLKDAFSTALLW